MAPPGRRKPWQPGPPGHQLLAGSLRAQTPSDPARPSRPPRARSRDPRRPRQHELQALVVVATPLSATQPPTA
eukprot:8518362-Alexandrium_andersonii.AAC.1